MGADDAHWFAWAALRYRPRPEQFKILLEIVSSIQHLPDAERYARKLTLRLATGNSNNVSVLDSPAGREYLDSLEANGNQPVRRAVAHLRDLIEQEALQKQQAEGPVVRPRPSGPQRVRFEPVEISFPETLRSPTLQGWTAAGPGVDLVWIWSSSQADLCVMKQPGQLRQIWQAKAAINAVVWDGRFAWVTVRRSGTTPPRLLVVDPQQQRIWEIDEGDGLPVVPQQTLPNPRARQDLWVEAIEPGRALLISHFGRMTISNVTFDPDKGANVDVFFEARVQPDLTEAEPWRNPQMAFRPEYLLRFQTDGDGAGLPRRVLVGGRSPYDEDWPLLVDPDTCDVSVLPTSIRHGIDYRRVARTPDAVFRTKYNRLYRIGLPDFRAEILLQGVPEGYCLKHGDKFLIFGLKCWQVDPAAEPDRRVRVLADRLPWPFEDTTAMGFDLAREEHLPPDDVKSYRLELITHSSHYGWLAIRREFEPINESVSRNVKDEAFRIVLDEVKEDGSR